MKPASKVGGRPLIGVSTSEVRLAERVTHTPQGEPPQREMALGLRYLAAIERAGGLPVVMPPMELDAVEPLLEHLSGVCLSGGPDLDPASYRARAHPDLGPTEPELDRFELALASAADARELPVLAICRGVQALNVARGGTLEQHLPERTDGALEHRQSRPADCTTHLVQVTESSQLASLLGCLHVEVNSFHHQAAKRLGRGLAAVAWAPDGVIEGLEAIDREFMVGVQWHAECIVDRPEHAALFSALVGAARRYESSVAGFRAA